MRIFNLSVITTTLVAGLAIGLLTLFPTRETSARGPFSYADAVEVAVRKVMQADGEVEVLHNHKKLEEIGNIGALLRY